MSIHPTQPPSRLYRRFKGWTGIELQSTVFPPLQWIVPDLLPAGLSLLVGSPKIGKSWLALDIALAVAAGGKALGGFDVEPGDVLYLALEDGPSRLADRQNLLLGRQPASSRFHAYFNWKTGEEAVTAAWEWCEDHPQARLVVVDTLARVRERRTRSGNDYEADTNALVPWQKLAEHFKISVLVVHHDRKASSDDFVDVVSGTNGLAGVADTTLVLQRDRMADYGTLKLTGRDVQEQEITLHRSGPTWIGVDGPPPDPNLGDRSAEIVGYVAEHGPIGASDIATGLGLSPDSIYKPLTRLVDSGRLSKLNRGTYVASDVRSVR